MLLKQNLIWSNKDLSMAVGWFFYKSFLLGEEALRRSYLSPWGGRVYFLLSVVLVEIVLASLSLVVWVSCLCKISPYPEDKEIISLKEVKRRIPVVMEARNSLVDKWIQRDALLFLPPSPLFMNRKVCFERERSDCCFF